MLTKQMLCVNGAVNGCITCDSAWDVLQRIQLNITVLNFGVGVLLALAFTAITALFSTLVPYLINLKLLISSLPLA